MNKVLLPHILQVAQVAGGQQPEEGDAAAAPGPVPPDRGPLPRLRQEGLRLQLLVWERWGGPHRPRTLQLRRGNQGMHLLSFVYVVLFLLNLAFSNEVHIILQFTGLKR